MSVAGIRVKVSHFITLMLSAVVAACSKSTMLVTIGFIRASSSCRLASLATAITFALPFCAVFAEAIYVANSNNNTLSKFDASGQYVSTLWNRGPGYDPYFSGPSALAFDSQGNLFVANSGNSTLSKFDASGQYVSTLWNRGPGYDRFLDSPSALAFDSQGNLFVANSGNSTLSKFDASGQYVSTLWNRGPGYDPYFSVPSAIAIRAVPAPSSGPEIDANSIGSVLALVLGSLGLLERRRLQAA
jgi:WD40 repeat protein